MAEEGFSIETVADRLEWERRNVAESAAKMKNIQAQLEEQSQSVAFWKKQADESAEDRKRLIAALHEAEQRKGPSPAQGQEEDLRTIEADRDVQLQRAASLESELEELRNLGRCLQKELGEKASELSAARVTKGDLEEAKQAASFWKHHCDEISEERRRLQEELEKAKLGQLNLEWHEAEVAKLQIRLDQAGEDLAAQTKLTLELQTGQSDHGSTLSGLQGQLQEAQGHATQLDKAVREIESLKAQLVGLNLTLSQKDALLNELAGQDLASTNDVLTQTKEALLKELEKSNAALSAAKSDVLRLEQERLALQESSEQHLSSVEETARKEERHKQGEITREAQTSERTRYEQVLASTMSASEKEISALQAQLDEASSELQRLHAAQAEREKHDPIREALTQVEQAQAREKDSMARLAQADAEVLALTQQLRTAAEEAETLRSECTALKYYKGKASGGGEDAGALSQQILAKEQQVAKLQRKSSLDAKEIARLGQACEAAKTKLKQAQTEHGAEEASLREQLAHLTANHARIEQQYMADRARWAAGSMEPSGSPTRKGSSGGGGRGSSEEEEGEESLSSMLQAVAPTGKQGRPMLEGLQGALSGDGGFDAPEQASPLPYIGARRQGPMSAADRHKVEDERAAFQVQTYILEGAIDDLKRDEEECGGMVHGDAVAIRELLRACGDWLKHMTHAAGLPRPATVIGTASPMAGGEVESEREEGPGVPPSSPEDPNPCSLDAEEEGYVAAAMSSVDDEEGNPCSAHPEVPEEGEARFGLTSPVEVGEYDENPLNMILQVAALLPLRLMYAWKEPLSRPMPRNERLSLCTDDPTIAILSYSCCFLLQCVGEIKTDGEELQTEMAHACETFLAWKLAWDEESAAKHKAAQAAWDQEREALHQAWEAERVEWQSIPADEAMEALMEKLQAANQGLQNDLTEARGGMEKLNAKLAQASGDLHDEKAKRASEIQASHQDMEALKQDLATAQAKSIEASREAEPLREALKEQEHIVEKQLKEITRLVASVDNLEREKQEVREATALQLAQAMADMADVSEKAQELLDAELALRNSAVDEAEDKLAQALQDNADLHRLLKETELQLHEKEAVLLGAELARSELEEVNRKLEEELAALRAEHESLHADLASRTKLLEETQIKLSALEKKHSELLKLQDSEVHQAHDEMERLRLALEASKKETAEERRRLEEASKEWDGAKCTYEGEIARLEGVTEALRKEYATGEEGWEKATRELQEGHAGAIKSLKYELNKVRPLERERDELVAVAAAAAAAAAAWGSPPSLLSCVLCAGAFCCWARPKQRVTAPRRSCVVQFSQADVLWVTS